MTTFADSSALVKLYADEDGNQQIRQLDGLVISQIARVEVPAALWRKHRSGELDADSASVLVLASEADYFGTEDEPPRPRKASDCFPSPDSSAQGDLGRRLALSRRWSR